MANELKDLAEVIVDGWESSGADVMSMVPRETQLEVVLRQYSCMFSELFDTMHTDEKNIIGKETQADIDIIVEFDKKVGAALKAK